MSALPSVYLLYKSYRLSLQWGIQSLYILLLENLRAHWLFAAQRDFMNHVVQIPELEEINANNVLRFKC